MGRNLAVRNMFQLILTKSLIVVFSPQGAMFLGLLLKVLLLEVKLSTHPHKMTHFVLPGILAAHIVEHGIQVELTE